MSEEDSFNNTGWQIDRKIPVSVLFGMFVQTVVLIIWAVNLQARVASNEANILRIDTTSVKAEAVARLDEKMNGVKDELGSLKTEMGGIKDEMRRMSIHGK